MLMFSFDILTFPLSLSPTGRSSNSCKPLFNYMLKVFINSTLIFFFQERPHSLGSFCLSLPDTGSATLPDFNSTSLRQWCHPERLAYFWEYGINSSWDPGKYCGVDTFTCGFQGCVLPQSLPAVIRGFRWCLALESPFLYSNTWLPFK